MIRRIAPLAVSVARPAPAQSDWRTTLGVLYALSCAIPACEVRDNRPPAAAAARRVAGAVV